MVMYWTSESDSNPTTSPSPSQSPQQVAYYVESHSTDTEPRYDVESSGSRRTTPLWSPGTPLSGRNSSSSGFYIQGRIGRMNRRGWTKPYMFNQEEEEEENGDYPNEDASVRIGLRVASVVSGMAAIFAGVCLIMWLSGRSYEPDVVVKGISVDYFHSSIGLDYTGLLTTLISVNCSLHISIHNHAPTFGIHVNSDTINIKYLKITVGSGQLQKYYQPMKSSHDVIVVVQGDQIPIYGAGVDLSLSNIGGSVPLTLDFEIFSRGYIVGKLVTVKHTKHISCPLIVDSSNIKPIKFFWSKCTKK